jgi:hypothetical protein
MTECEVVPDNGNSKIIIFVFHLSTSGCSRKDVEIVKCIILLITNHMKYMQ